MSRLPRTPEFFPKMKVRGSRRQRLAPWQRAAGAFNGLGMTLQELTDAMKGLWRAFE